MTTMEPDSPTPEPDRPTSFQTGISAESRAAAFLVGHGFRIVARRFRCRAGEIDIIARRKRLLVFVEVKAREKLIDAVESITPRQQRRIVAAAEAWLGEHPEHGQCEFRFDVILIAPGTKPRIVPAAFDASP
jgi:putative endonuclease